MKVSLVTVGKTDVKWVREGLDLYVSRLSHYIPFTLDEIPELYVFGEKLEKAALQTIAGGKMTGDLAAITTLPKESVKVLESKEFILAIRDELISLL